MVFLLQHSEDDILKYQNTPDLCTYALKRKKRLFGLV